MNLLHRVYTTFHRRVWIVSKDLLKDGEIGAHSVFQMRCLEADLLGAYAAFRSGHGESAAKRLAEGHRAMLVCDNGRIIGAVWAATGRAFIPYLNRDILLRPRELYTYDAFTHPEYRKRGVSSVRDGFLTSEFRRLGYDRAAAIVAFENQAGLRSAEAAGYKRMGSFSCVRLGVAQIDLPRSGSGSTSDLPRFVLPFNYRAGYFGSSLI